MRAILIDPETKTHLAKSMERAENVSLETLLAVPSFASRAAQYSAEFGEPRIGAILALIGAAGDFYEEECDAGIHTSVADDLLNLICPMLRGETTE
jgi:hypothetical protein